VLEGGCGAGAALLCLAHRVAGVAGVGVERDPALVRLARANAAANGAAALSFVAADLAEVRLDGVFDHALANPPWHLVSASASPDGGRDGAKRGAPGLFAVWAKRLAAPLRHGGTLTLVMAAARLPDGLAALAAAGCGSPAVLPLWPKPGRDAKLALLRGVKGGRGACRLLPGLSLHCPDGAYTEAATAILSDGAPLPF